MQLEHEHTTEAIRKRLDEENKPNYVRDWVYGGIDGAVTTFAIVAGVVGAGLSSNIILILGLANLIADGFSMAASNYSGTKTEVDDVARLREIERRHIALAPEGERQEIRQILMNKGLEGNALEEAVKAITSNEEVWIDTMLVEEYGASPVLRSPFQSGLSTFLAFIICGAVPLLPFLIFIPMPFITATILTGAVFFAIGSLKSYWALSSWWKSGIETFAIGMIAAGAAYFIGDALKGFA
ncbi:MAG: VIT1/CCC1 transporter family protein [Methyloligellaceae bacterium]